ncbi:S-layer homology domain-containing protein [Alteribacillus sp. YIM 98480]|uniref:S-layer homology domain-containing protein n=1 Tax=Alteribacillus sp. YIM 98480 TaxID=2606599 RepID=UPI00131DAF5D|nr:S-layer homology domain-containing protein [Alteribacillus sp. YIM 98480]
MYNNITNNKTWPIIISVVLIMGIGMGSFKNQTKAAEAFSDVDNSYWASEQIQRLAEQNVISGYSDGTYKPGEKINRGQVAALLTESFDLQIDKNPKSTTFDDLNENSYFTPYAEAVKDAGYMTGRNNNTAFAAGMNLSREQMASILVRAFEFERIDENESIVKDINKAHESHQNSIETLAQIGVTKTNNGDFRPKETVTRAQFAVFLERALTMRHTMEAGIMYVTAVDKTTVDVSFTKEMEEVHAEDFAFEPELDVKRAEIINPEETFERHAGADMVIRLTTSEQSVGEPYWFYYQGKRTDNIIVGAEE